MKNKTLKGFLIICLVLILILFNHIEYLNNNPKIEEVIIEKEVEVEVIKEVVSEVYIEKEEEKYYDITQEEREMLARILYLEAGGTSEECQKMVLSVIFNRYEAYNREKSLKEIIYAKEQFTPAPLIKNTTPKEQQYRIVDYIVENGSVLPKYVRSFRAGHHFNYSGYIGYTSIDNVYFGYFAKDKGE